MPKTIIITENMVRSVVLNEAILLNQLPLDIQQTILSNETPLGNNPAVPSSEFLTKLLTSGLETSVKELKAIMPDADLNEINLLDELNSLLVKCQEIERPVRNMLEKICQQEVYNLLGVPDDAVDFTINLVDRIECEINAEPVSSDDYQYQDGEEMSSLELEVKKRLLINMLIMGESLTCTNKIINNLSGKYEVISDDLIDCYKKIVAINNYLLLTKSDIGITDKNNKQMGVVNLTFGNEQTKNLIEVQGTILPFLITEMIHGFMEIFAGHGLPENKEQTKLILSKTEYLKADPWNMRLGLPMVKKFHSSIGYIHMKAKPYFLMKLFQLPVNRFNELILEIFNGTERALRIVQPVKEKAEKDIERDNFLSRMSDKQKDNKFVITDEFISPEEL